MCSQKFTCCKGTPNLCFSILPCFFFVSLETWNQEGIRFGGMWSCVDSSSYGKAHWNDQQTLDGLLKEVRALKDNPQGKLCSLALLNCMTCFLQYLQWLRRSRRLSGNWDISPSPSSLCDMLEAPALFPGRPLSENRGMSGMICCKIYQVKLTLSLVVEFPFFSNTKVRAYARILVWIFSF